MNQDKKPTSTRDVNDWLKQVLVPISAVQARIQTEIEHGCPEDKQDGWRVAQRSLDDVVKRLEDIAAIPIPLRVDEFIARQASFPELNPNPVLEISLEGEITFANLATRTLFPDIMEKKSQHPFLEDIDQIIKDTGQESPKAVSHKAVIRDVQVGDHFFRQSIFFIKEYGCLRVYALDITRHIQTEESLRRSQNLLRAVMDNTPDPIFLKDTNSRILMANPATAVVIGKPLEQIIGKNDLEYYDDPAVGKAIIENDLKVMQTGQTQVIEERVLTRDGEHIYLSTKTPYRDHTGKVIAIIGVARDITERKQREEELARLNKTLRAISNCNQALMRMQDETSLMEEVCRIIVRDCGYAMVWIGMAEMDDAKTVRPMASAGFEEGYLDTLHITWADNERGRGPTGTAIRTGQVSMCRNMLTDPAFKPWRAEAVKRGYASSIVFPLLAGGETIGALTIYSRKADPFSEPEVSLLTELAGDLAFGINTIRLRGAQSHAAEALRLSEERYHSLFTGMSEGYALHEMIYDEQGVPCDYHFLDINPAFERLTSLQREVVLGRSHNQVLPDDDPRWVKIYGEVALTGTPIHFENYSPALKKHYEVFAYRPAMDQFAVLFMDITERKYGGPKTQKGLISKLEQRVQERTQALAIANEELKKEIEVRKATELELRESETRLTQALKQEQTLRDQLIQAEKNSALARMVASVAHEINNPIQTIKNCLYLLENQVDPAFNSNEILAMASSETSRIGDLVGRLREIYKPSRDLRPKAFNILDVLRDVQSLLAPHLQTHNVTWALSTDTDCPMVNGVADQIKQVFLNIVNGIDAMEDHGGRLTVKVSTDNSCQVIISFNDTGKGIPPDDLPQVFEPFFTTKDKGSGLGLSICYDIVSNFNGNIFASSAPGEESHVYCYPSTRLI